MLHWAGHGCDGQRAPGTRARPTRSPPPTPRTASPVSNVGSEPRSGGQHAVLVPIGGSPAPRGRPRPARSPCRDGEHHREASAKRAPTARPQAVRAPRPSPLASPPRWHHEREGASVIANAIAPMQWSTAMVPPASAQCTPCTSRRERGHESPCDGPAAHLRLEWLAAQQRAPTPRPS